MAKKAKPDVRETTTEHISENKLKSLLRDSRAAYRDTRSIAGTLGESIAQAVEHNHLHRKAFAAVRAEDRMEPDKLAEYYDTLELYRDMCGLTERAKSAPKFPHIIEGGRQEAAE
jgi:hypothetical protein